MTSSEDRRNVLRTLMARLVGAIGCDVIPADEDRAPAANAGTWARVTITDTEARYSGRVAGPRRTRVDMLVTVDLFARSNAAEQVASIDAIDERAAEAAQVLSYLSLPIKDYVSDPTGGTALQGIVFRTIQPATVRHLPKSDGYVRRMIEAAGFYHIVHGA
jgi:hypothetical protein